MSLHHRTLYLKLIRSICTILSLQLVIEFCVCVSMGLMVYFMHCIFIKFNFLSTYCVSNIQCEIVSYFTCLLFIFAVDMVPSSGKNSKVQCVSRGVYSCFPFAVLKKRS